MAETSEAEKAVTKIESDNLSQLVARILNQLAVSAWLPSAALVLAVAFILRLGTVLTETDEADLQRLRNGEPETPLSPLGAVARAFEALGATPFGGVLLMLAAVVVLTMLTQAFTFEAIRLLEGYWGTGVDAERFARRRCETYRARRDELEANLAQATADAWKETRKRLKSLQKKDPDLTNDVITLIGNRIKGETQRQVTLTEEQQAIADDFRWKDFAPGELYRQRVNILRRLADFPAASRVLPTRLGNILRHWEDETGVESIESLVDQVYESLPMSLRITHDEQRGRLDLYCSMSFVCLSLIPVVLLAFGVQHLPWAFGGVGLCLVSAWFTYRAAIASARYYGSLLPTIARYLTDQSIAQPPPQLAIAE